MSRSIQRLVRRNRPDALRRPVVESLEGRRLLTLLCSLSNGVLTVLEQNAGVNNRTTLESFNNNTQIEIAETSDPMNENQALYNGGWRVSNDFTTAVGSEAGINRIVVDTDDGIDTLTITNINLPVSIQPHGAASEAMVFGDPNSALGMQGITGAITFDATDAQSASFTLNDAMDPADLDPTITATTIEDLAPAPINFTAPPRGNLAYYPLAVTVDGGTGRCAYALNEGNSSSANIAYIFHSHGQSTIGLENLNAASEAIVNADAGGSQRVLLGSAGLISSVTGAVEIEANGGTASLSIDDHNDPDAHTFDVVPDQDVVHVKENGALLADLDVRAVALTLDTGQASNTVNLDLSGFTAGFATTVQAFGGSTINVNNVPATGELDVIGGGTGVSRVSVKPNSVAGTVHISDPTGQEAVLFDGSDITTPQTITISDSNFTGMGSGKYSLANLAFLDVTGGSALDNFSVTPSTTVSIGVDGGDEASAPTDRLAIVTTGVNGTALSLRTNSPESGQYTFANRQPVGFTDFAAISPSVGDITGTVYDAQSAGIVAGATVIVDENDNGVADPGEPTTTTDANGAFTLTGLPIGTFALVVKNSGFQQLGTPSVTIAAGVLSTPLAVPIVPDAVAGGPDLVASVSVVAAGKTATNKPKLRVKVTNIGAAMTSATPLKIVIAASTDATFDPADSVLLSATSTPALLKSKQSKTLNFTGFTGASLPKGSYFIVAAIDTANAVAESNESNNVAATAKAVPLAPSAVDLTGKFAKLPKTAAKAKPLTIGFSLENLGTLTAVGNVDFGIFASTDKTVDDADPALGAGFHLGAHLAGGKSQTTKFKLTLLGLSAGSYYLFVKVNSNSTIAESDTTNNTVFSATPITVS